MTRPDLDAARREAEEALRRWHDRSTVPDPLSLASALRSLLAATTPAPSSPPPPASEAVRKAVPQLEGFCVQAEADARPPGGQQAGLDKSWASRVPPSVLAELRWYAREFRRLLAALDAPAPEPDGKEKP